MMKYMWDVQCVLASIIVVALKGMLMKVTEFMKFWRLDKTDGSIWAVTFIVVVLFDIEYGLLAGVLLCIGKLLVLAMRPYTCKLALAPGTELYLDSKRYKGVRRTCNFKKLFFLDINLFLLLRCVIFILLEILKFFINYIEFFRFSKFDKSFKWQVKNKNYY